MKLNITSKGVELTKGETLLIERKLGKLDRHFDGIINTRVEIIEETTRSRQHRFLVRVSVSGSSTQLHGEERGETVLAAVDKVSKIMQRQVEHHKGKLRNKKGRTDSPAIEETEQTGELSPQRQYVVKQLDVKPMPLPEATDQMELLGYEFFFFYNTDSEKLSLLYRRKDGNYGLIEPQRG
ncbi:ribosome hibernation-promoting factor, HPF/YfiA family [Chloroflexota bacterium]